MHITTLFFSAFVATTIAQTDFCAGNKDTLGYCETLSYVDRTLNATDAPLASDCQDACRGVLSDAGDWLVDFKGTLHLFHPHETSVNFQLVPHVCMSAFY
jgi:hypothetical protein